MALQLQVLTPEELFMDALHFENESNREKALRAFENCIAQNTEQVCIDYGQACIEEVYDFSSRELELLLGFLGDVRPDLSRELSADVYLPTKELEPLNFKFGFAKGKPDELELLVRDINAFREATATALALLDNLAEGEEQRMLSLMLATFRDAAVLAMRSSALLAWSY